MIVLNSTSIIDIYLKVPLSDNNENHTEKIAYYVFQSQCRTAKATFQRYLLQKCKKLLCLMKINLMFDWR